MVRVQVIASRSEFLTACQTIAAGVGPIAIDAERASGYTYSQRAYLIQVHRRNAGTFLFDPPAIGDMSDLQQVTLGCEWVLHAASQDLACLRDVGIFPTKIFDTELSARLLGMERVGLGAVVEELLGIHLKKSTVRPTGLQGLCQNPGSPMLRSMSSCWLTCAMRWSTGSSKPTNSNLPTKSLTLLWQNLKRPSPPSHGDDFLVSTHCAQPARWRWRANCGSRGTLLLKPVTSPLVA